LRIGKAQSAILNGDGGLRLPLTRLLRRMHLPQQFARLVHLDVEG
jgi:hypothetical protein